jgi:hypothetical protein
MDGAPSSQYFLAGSIAVAASFADELHRGPIDPVLILKLFSPGERGDVAKFMERLVWHEAELLAQGGARVGIGSVIEEKPGEGVVAAEAGAPGLRDDAAEEGGMPAKAFRVGWVDGGGGVGAGAVGEQPLGDFKFVVIDAEVKEGGAGKRGAVKGVGGIGTAAELDGKDLLVGESAMEESGVAVEVGLEQIEAAAMDGHGQGVGQGEAVGIDQFKAGVLAGRVAAVGLEDEAEGGERVAQVVSEGRAQFEKEGQAGAGEGFAGAHDGADFRASAHSVKFAGGFEAALEAGAAESELKILCAELAKHGDDGVLAEVGGVGHGRSPVALDAAGVFGQQARVLQDEFSDGVDVTLTDGVGHATGVDEAEPAGQAVTAGEDELGVGEGGGGGVENAQRVFLKSGHGGGVLLAESGKQIFGLVAELFEVGADGDIEVGMGWDGGLAGGLGDGIANGLAGGLANGHTDLLESAPASACSGKEIRETGLVVARFRWTRSCPRIGGVL